MVLLQVKDPLEFRKYLWKEGNFFISIIIIDLFKFSAVIEEISCPVGTINRNTGAPNISSCEPCPAGYYCQEGVYTESGQCDEGYYCPSPIPNVYAAVPQYIGSYGPRQVDMWL